MSTHHFLTEIEAHPVSIKWLNEMLDSMNTYQHFVHDKKLYRISETPPTAEEIQAVVDALPKAHNYAKRVDGYKKIEREKDEDEKSGFEYVVNGETHKYYSDIEDQVNIIGLSSDSAHTNNSYPITTRDANGEDVVVMHTPEDLRGLLEAGAAFKYVVSETSKAKKKALEDSFPV